MKLIISILLTALLSFVICLYLPWWTISIAAFLVSLLIHQKPVRSFLTGFIALFLLWGIMAWWIDIQNGHILSGKMARLLSLGGSSFLMVFVTAFIGALIGGFAAIAASFLRERRKTS
ncbi:MAG: hypothetical protein QM726_17115 [Chitinophagaceae bacterium]